MKIGLAALALAGALFGFVLPVRADEPSTLMIGSGSWETLRDNYRTGEVDVDYRSSYKLWIFHPHAGFVVAGDGDFYADVGLLTDIFWTDHIVTTLGSAFGGYGGGGYNLGSHFEFRSGIDNAYRFSDGTRLGIGFYHISNAGITRENGGSESLLVEFTIPVGGF